MVYSTFRFGPQISTTLNLEYMKIHSVYDKYLVHHTTSGSKTNIPPILRLKQFSTAISIRSSYCNPTQVAISALLEEILVGKMGRISVLKISSYKAQSVLTEIGTGEAKTVTCCQGDTCDICLFSYAADHQTPFSDEDRRINVAISRARYLCLIIGGDATKNEKLRSVPTVNALDFLNWLNESARLEKIEFERNVTFITEK